MNKLAGIQYLGRSGITQPCIEAITRLISTGEEITKVFLLSHKQTHAFLLENVYEEVIGVKAGFTSGYFGEGPRGLAMALKILKRHGIDVEEYEVTKAVIERLDRSCLLTRDIDEIKAQQPIRPLRWYEYIYEYDQDNHRDTSLASYYSLTIPFGLVDPRLIDLAVHFNKNPDAAIISAFRRLEDILRTRTGLAGEGVRLFSKAFQAEGCPLLWDVPDESEGKGRANLFIGTFMAFRNARVHREAKSSVQEAIREFLLVNELYKLEAESLTQAELANKRNEKKAIVDLLRHMHGDV